MSCLVAKKHKTAAARVLRAGFIEGYGSALRYLAHYQIQPSLIGYLLLIRLAALKHILFGYIRVKSMYIV
jgi:hypothetical protein